MESVYATSPHRFQNRVTGTLVGQDGANEHENHRNPLCLCPPRLIAWSKAFGVRGLLFAVRRATSGIAERVKLRLPQHGPINRCAGSDRLPVFRGLYAPRLPRRGRRTKVLLGSMLCQIKDGPSGIAASLSYAALFPPFVRGTFPKKEWR